MWFCGGGNGRDREHVRLRRVRDGANAPETRAAPRRGALTETAAPEPGSVSHPLSGEGPSVGRPGFARDQPDRTGDCGCGGPEREVEETCSAKVIRFALNAPRRKEGASF